MNQDPLMLSERVLVVEDDPALAALERAILEDEGIPTHWARTGREALDHLRNCRPRLVLLDFSLGDMTGLELVRAHQPMPPFIVATGAGDERIAVELMKLGARDYLVKDARFTDTLALVLRRVLKDLDTELRLARAEQDLAESRDRLAFALASTGMIHWEADLVTGEVTLSDGAAAVLGYDPEAFTPSLGWWEERVHPEDLPAVKANMATGIGSGTVTEGEYRFRSGSGAYLWLHGRGRVVAWDGDGRPRRLAGFWSDVTERRRAEDSRRQAEKAQSLTLMAAGVAHDFNNRFQAILSNLELAHHALAPASAAQVALSRAMAVLEDTARLSARILSFTGRGFRQPEPLDLGELLRGMQGELEARVARFPGAALQCRIPAGSLPLEGDPDQLGQVVQTLVQNAAEALPGPGRVDLRIGEAILDAADLLEGHWIERPVPGPSLVLEVSDAGPGLEAEVLDRLGDPFFSTKGPGRGLGLAAARGMVRSHRGGLQVLTEPGSGSRFRVWLPRPEEAPIDPVPQALPAVQRGRTLLLVDDEADLREAMAEALTDLLGYPVLQAADGVEAVDLFRLHGEDIALILMDAQMPRMGGTEAFEAIKRLRPGARALLCSGYGEAFGAATAKSCGFLGFLTKPFRLAELKAAVEKALASEGVSE